MALTTEFGVGTRRSVSEDDTFSEAIARVAGNFEWGISENSTLIQTLSIESGTETSIY